MNPFPPPPFFFGVCYLIRPPPVHIPNAAILSTPYLYFRRARSQYPKELFKISDQDVWLNMTEEQKRVKREY